MALSADSRPHFTTIADFISSMDAEVIYLFRDVILVCDDLRLIGKEMFAIDGCKMPSNASKEWSGTRADFEKKAGKLEQVIGQMVKAHQEQDGRQTDQDMLTRETQYVKTLSQRASKIRAWLKDHDGKPIKSNITDNESAKMKHKIDSSMGRALYSLRVAIVEPPFAHICRVMGLDRFTLRGKKKVNTQWNLFCMVHNLKKVARYGPGFA